MSRLKGLFSPAKLKRTRERERILTRGEKIYKWFVLETNQVAKIYNTQLFMRLSQGHKAVVLGRNSIYIKIMSFERISFSTETILCCNKCKMQGPELFACACVTRSGVSGLQFPLQCK